MHAETEKVSSSSAVYMLLYLDICLDPEPGACAVQHKMGHLVLILSVCLQISSCLGLCSFLLAAQVAGARYPICFALCRAARLS